MRGELWILNWAQAASLRQQGGGTERRIDFIILDDKGNAIKSYEVTSKTADKIRQSRKKMQLGIVEVLL